MTTIILTIIGILLAAAAALMVIFYGGDAFNSGSIGAQANTLQNAGTNVISAVQLYKAEGAEAPTGTSEEIVTALVTAEALDEAPAVPASVTAAFSDVDYQASGVSEEVCARVNENLKNGANTVDGDAPTARPAAKMGCFDATGDTTPNDGVFFANY